MRDRLAHAVGRLVDHERHRQTRDRREELTPRLRRGGQETQEHESLGGEARRRHGRDGRVRAGNRHDGKSRVADRAHQPRAGIADRRRAGIADQRDAAPRAELRDDLRGARRFVVLVQRQRTGRDAVVPQQHAGHARVLGRNDVDAAEDVQRAQRQVAQISERVWQPHIMFPAQRGSAWAAVPPLPPHLRFRPCEIRPRSRDRPPPNHSGMRIAARVGAVPRSRWRSRSGCRHCPPRNLPRQVTPTAGARALQGRPDCVDVRLATRAHRARAAAQVGVVRPRRRGGGGGIPRRGRSRQGEPVVIGHGDGEVLAAFAKAKDAGARVIVGPLVRDDMKVLAAPVSICRRPSR